MLHQITTLNLGGRLLSLEQPVVMGILNVTPDSFYDGGRYQSKDRLLAQVDKMLTEGAAIIDVGGMSSRPGAEIIGEEEELRRVINSIDLIRKVHPQALISVDTIRARVAAEAVSAGANMVNDISAGRIDEKMYETVAELKVPYILMHMQNQPADMQVRPEYGDVVQEILDFFIAQIGKLRSLGVLDIVVDPGFGFGKTVEHNYQLLNNLHVFKILDVPVLAGISRKSMICKVLKIKPDNALNGTTALHMVALQQGARILRVHDVKPAVETIQLYLELEKVNKTPG